MQEVVLNLLPNGVPPVCYISQYDGTSRVIRFHLLNGTEPLTLNGSETITLNFRKPNREEVTLAIENTSSNYIDLVISSELSDKHGEGFGEFRIQGLGTLSFKMYIESDAYGDSLKTRSVSGPIATFETDLAEDLIKLDVDLEPIQDLHGYDYPWPAGGGKNIACLSEDTVYDLRKITAQYIDNNNIVLSVAGTYSLGIYKIPCTIGKTYTVSFRGICTANYKRVYISKNDNVSGSGNYYGILFLSDTEELYRTLTFTAETDNIYIGFYIGTSGDPGTATINDFMIEEGSTATAFAPYENVCPISGHDSAILNRVGKNWLNLNRTNTITNSGLYPSTIRAFTENDIWIGISRNNYFNNSRISSYSIISNEVTVLTTAGGYGVGFPIRCKPSTAYKMANKEGYSIGIGFFDVDGNYLSDTTGSTFTTPNNCVWILVVFSGTANVETSYTNPQLELGSTATDYEPYESDPTPITVQFGQTVYKGKLDSARRKIIVYFAGRAIRTFPWTYYEAEAYPGYFATGNTTDKAYNTNYICECFNSVNKARGSLENGELGVYNLTNGSRRFIIRYDAITTVNDLLTQFGDYLICYELAEPIEIDLTQVQTADIEATGVASFETTLAMPLNTSEHYFSCSQDEGTPTPDDPIPITGVSEITAYRTGKNLLSPALYRGISYNPTVGTTVTLTESTKQLTDNHDGTFSISTTVNWETFCMIVPIKNITYYRKTVISSNGALGTSEVCLDKNLTVLSVYNNTDTTQTKNGLLIIPDNASYFAWIITNRAVANSTLTITQPQIELGSTATEYEPYSGESITVPLGGTYYGGKLVQQEDGSRKIVLTHGYLEKAVADMNNADTHPGWRNAGIKALVGESVSGTFDAILNIGNKYSCNTSGTNDILYLSTPVYNRTQTEWQTNYPDLIIKLCVPLATPIEIDLPDGDPLTTAAGENNVYCNTGDTALAYYYNMVADPIRIPALVGTNNVYSDAGDVDVEYYTTLEGGND